MLRSKVEMMAGFGGDKYKTANRIPHENIGCTHQAKLTARAWGVDADYSYQKDTQVDSPWVDRPLVLPRSQGL